MKRLRRLILASLLAALSLAVSSCISGGAQPPSSRPYLDGVVRISGGGRTCTGVLISPRLVLSAAHCFGFNSANPADRGITGGDTRCVIENSSRQVVGVGGCGTVSFTHLDGKATATATIRHVWVVEARSPGSSPHGRDLAIASLNLRATPRTSAAAPSTPVWFDGDPGAEHWKRAEIVYAGWGFIDLIADTCEGLRTASRGATRLGVEWRKRLDANFPVDSNSVAGPLGTPMFVANFNLYGDSTGLVLSGDSGGPLFSPDPTGTIRVIGTMSGNACFDSELSGTMQNLWARTFNEDNAALIRRVVMASTGRVRGSDASIFDSDGDGVAESPLPDTDPNIGELDNCVDRFNPDQRDSDNDGIGDACASCPSGICDQTPDPPANCRIGPHGASCGYANVQCDAPLPPADHRVVDETNHVTLPTIYQDSRTGRIDVAYTTPGNAELVVCVKVGRAPERCGKKFSVTLDPSPCTGSSVPPEFRCPAGQVRCQGVCKPIPECKFLK